MLPLLLAFLSLDAGYHPATIKKSERQAEEMLMPYTGGGCPDEGTWRETLPGLWRFPGRLTTRVRVEFLEALAANITNALDECDRIGAFESRNKLLKWRANVWKTTEAWRILDGIWTKPTGVSADIYNMERLRKMIGEDAYWAGRMPDLNYRYFERRGR